MHYEEVMLNVWNCKVHSSVGLIDAFAILYACHMTFSLMLHRSISVLNVLDRTVSFTAVDKIKAHSSFKSAPNIQYELIQ